MCAQRTSAWPERRKGDGRESARRPRTRCGVLAWSILLACPERIGPADDGADGKRTEITAVEGVLRLPIHQEDLIARDDTAAAPTGQCSAAFVVVERLA